jgi:hypothetical protein
MHTSFSLHHSPGPSVTRVLVVEVLVVLKLGVEREKDMQTLHHVGVDGNIEHTANNTHILLQGQVHRRLRQLDLAMDRRTYEDGRRRRREERGGRNSRTMMQTRPIAPSHDGD